MYCAKSNTLKKWPQSLKDKEIPWNPISMERIEIFLKPCKAVWLGGNRKHLCQPLAKSQSELGWIKTKLKPLHSAEPKDSWEQVESTLASVKTSIHKKIYKRLQSRQLLFSHCWLFFLHRGNYKAFPGQFNRNCWSGGPCLVHKASSIWLRYHFLR